jgi:hypothetical protein
MKSHLFHLALAAAVHGLPTPEDVSPPDAPFMGQAMEVINALAEGKLAEIMGGDHATEQFTDMARVLGAGRGKVGEISSLTRDVFNGMSPHFASHTLTIAAGYGKMKPSPGDAPLRVEMTPRYALAGTKTVKMRYGPYKVPNMNKKNMVGEYGSLFNWPDTFERPCAGNCTIFGAQSGLEFGDGTSA